MERGQVLKVEKENRVAWVILNRHDRRNIMTMEFLGELTRLFREPDSHPEVRVVVIRAEGKTFTAGLDLVAAQELIGDGPMFQGTVTTLCRTEFRETRARMHGNPV